MKRPAKGVPGCPATSHASSFCSAQHNQVSVNAIAACSSKISEILKLQRGLCFCMQVGAKSIGHLSI